MEIFEQKLIAKGGTADIYDLGNGTIFKCFHDDKNDYCIESEIQCTSSKVAIALGAPQILERVNDERGRGFIMENIRGQTMLEKKSRDLVLFLQTSLGKSCWNFRK